MHPFPPYTHRDHGRPTAHNIYYLTLYRKSFPTSASGMVLLELTCHVIRKFFSGWGGGVKGNAQSTHLRLTRAPGDLVTCRDRWSQQDVPAQSGAGVWASQKQQINLQFSLPLICCPSKILFY